jgi:hypothetical protein
MQECRNAKNAKNAGMQAITGMKEWNNLFLN